MANYQWQITRNGRRYVRIEGAAPAPAKSDARIAVEPDTPDFVAKVEEPIVEVVADAPVEVAAPVAVPTTPKPKTIRKRRSSKKKSDG